MNSKLEFCGFQCMFISIESPVRWQHSLLVDICIEKNKNTDVSWSHPGYTFTVCPIKCGLQQLQQIRLLAMDKLLDSGCLTQTSCFNMKYDNTSMCLTNIWTALKTNKRETFITQ